MRRAARMARGSVCLLRDIRFLDRLALAPSEYLFSNAVVQPNKCGECGECGEAAPTRFTGFNNPAKPVADVRRRKWNSGRIRLTSAATLESAPLGSGVVS